MDLERLFCLQELEYEQKRIQQEKQRSPILLELRNIKQSFEEKKAAYLQLGAAAKQLEEEISSLPKRIQEAELRLQEEQKAIYCGSVTSTKALKARELQVAACEEKLADLTAQHLSYLRELEQEKEQLAAMKEEMGVIYADFRNKKAEAIQSDSQAQQRLEELTHKIEELLPTIDAADLSWFRREEKGQQGPCIARMTGDMVCGGCHRMATLALFKRAKSGNKICSCEQCGKILFIDD